MMVNVTKSSKSYCTVIIAIETLKMIILNLTSVLLTWVAGVLLLQLMKILRQQEKLAPATIVVKG